MSVENTSAFSGPYTANGVTTVFPFTFQAASAAEVEVTLNGTPVVSGVTISLLGDSTGSATFAVAPASGTVYVRSKPNFTQELVLQRFGPYYPDTLNEPLDRAAKRDIYLLSLTTALQTTLAAILPAITAAQDAALLSIADATTAFNLNASTKTTTFNDNATTKTGLVNAASSAGLAAIAAASAAAVNDFSNAPLVYATHADALSNGVIGNGAITAGSGGTNGTFVGTVTGGGGTGAAFLFVVSGGALQAPLVWLNKGRGYTSAPTLGFTASSGLTGASATAIIGPNTPVGQFAMVAHSDGYFNDTYQNVSGSLLLQRTAASATGATIASWMALRKAPGVLTPLPTTPLYLWYAEDAYLMERMMIPNASAALPTRNMFQLPSRMTVNGGIVTFGQADPWGRNTAVRVQQPLAGNYVTLLQTITAEAGSYRFRTYGRSYPGAGAQTLDIRFGFGSPVSSQAIAEGAYNTTPNDLLVTMVNSSTVNAYKTAGPYPLDALISIPEVTRPEVVLATPPVPATGGMVGSRMSRPGTITIDAKGNMLTSGYAGRLKFTEDGIATQSFTAQTVVLCFKQIAADTSTTNALYFGRSTTGSFADLELGTGGSGGTRLRASMPGLISNLNASWTAFGDEHIVAVYTFDGTSSAFYVNGVKVQSGTGTGGGALTMATAFFGGQGFNDTAPNTLQFSGGLLDNFKYSDTQVMNASKHFRDHAIFKNNLIGVRTLYIALGDSLAAYFGLSEAQGFVQLASLAVPPIKYLNRSFSGTSLGTPSGPNPANSGFLLLPEILPIIDQHVAFGGRALVSSAWGVNVTPAIDDYVEFSNILQDHGAIHGVATTSVSVDKPYSETVALRNTLLANAYRFNGGIIDVGGTSEFGADLAYNNTTNYQGDKKHWTAAGNLVVKPLYQNWLQTYKA